jgi:hypothetical protein
MNKKGVMWSDIKDAILTAIVIAIGIYIIWAYFLHGGVKNVDTLQKCGSLTGNNGLCKESCDSTEMAFENLGCTGAKNICCVAKNKNMDDVVLPSGYGGNTQYDFKVTKIEFGEPPDGCTFEKSAIDTIICKPGSAYQIPVIITITNLNRAVEVYADPIAVINGNGDTVKGTGTFSGTEPAKLSTKGETSKVSSEIIITAKESIDNNYWEIYPYARCITTECRKTDTSGSRGIMSMNNNELVTIKFIGTTVAS